MKFTKERQHYVQTSYADFHENHNAKQHYVQTSYDNFHENHKC